MNQIPKRDRTSERLAHLRDVVGRQSLPGFVTGFDLKLGEFDDDPAVWITFASLPLVDLSGTSTDERLQQMTELAHRVRAAILDDPEAPFPYFRFPEAEQADRSIQ